ncbi:hypothetical protein GD1_117 [Paraglaciecola Antarctic GD virus 1]|nr:hypothetical protein GD1_117 [Paraglaciecola Antarctic GD virus 1]
MQVITSLGLGVNSLMDSVREERGMDLSGPQKLEQYREAKKRRRAIKEQARRQKRLDIISAPWKSYWEDQRVK